MNRYPVSTASRWLSGWTLLSIWVAHASARGRGVCPDPKAGTIARYDPSTQVCCGGNVLSAFEEGGDTRAICCGHRTYNPRTEVCCGGEVRGNGDQCCGFRHWYDPYTQVCCGNKVRSMEDENGAQCCGGAFYHPLRASCCHDNLRQGIPELPMLQACCGSESYSKTDEICCEGTVFKRGESTACCGLNTYNSSSELCCGLFEERTVHSKTYPTETCCGMATYDPATQTCCETSSRTFDLVGGECCGTHQAYDPSQATCCQGFGGEILQDGFPRNESRCCGVYIMSDDMLCDPLSETLIRKNDPSHDAFCRSPNAVSSTTYNSGIEVCMEDGRIEKLSRTVAVCGYELYDPTAEICCDQFIRGRFNEDGIERECCLGTIFSFEPATQTCCLGNIYDIPSAEAACCRTNAYDISTHACYDGVIIRSLEEMALFPELCGNIPYNPADDSCCGSHLLAPGQICCMDYPTPLPSGAETGECCMYYAYVPTSQVCCDGMVHEKDSDDTTCCGQMLLTNADQEICCEGAVRWREGGRDQCEGRVAFNPSTETVCGGAVFPVADGACCGDLAYDRTEQTCCNGQLHQATGENFQCCGTSLYDETDYRVSCCNGRLLPSEPGFECCGETLIDPLTQSCCHNDRLPFVLSRSHHPSISCCDPATHASTQHTCCGGIEHKFVSNGGCCGLDVIRNPTEEICCAGTVVTRNYGEHTECCQGRLFDNREATCCGGRLIFAGSTEECCDDVVINSYYQTCCGGEAYLHTDRVGCCSGVTYSLDNQGCCGNEIFSLSTEYCSDSEISVIDSEDNAKLDVSLLSLCDEGGYDPVTQTCCGNFVLDIDSNYICCNGQPADASSGKSSCCAGTPYNPDNFDCCAGLLHHRFEGAQCCGSSYYQPIKETCCDDGTVVSILLGETCPGSADTETFDRSRFPQCICTATSRPRNISQACAETLRFKQRVFMARVTDASPECSGLGAAGACPWDFSILPLRALRGGLPRNQGGDSEGAIQVAAPIESGCGLPSLRRDQKIVVFLESETAMEDAFLRLTENDVVIPHSRKLERQMANLL